MKRRAKQQIYTVVLVFLFVFVIFSSVLNFPIQHTKAADNWWNNSYNYRQLITINSSQIPSTLTNFPVLINIDSDSDLSLNAQPDGDDIVFIDYDDNTTQYNHENEHYSAGTLQSWVNITSLSSSVDTLIWIYYGNSSVSSQENIAGTWDSNYAGVWHFDDDSLLDSTSNGYDATTSGTTDSDNGAVAGCREFTYTNGENVSVDPWGGVGEEFTAECWVNSGSSLSEYIYPRYMIQGDAWNSNSDWVFYGRTAALNFRMVYNSTVGSATQGGVHPPAGDFWFYLAYNASVANNKQVLRVNKSFGYTTWLAGVVNDDSNPYLTFGNTRDSAGAKSFDGWMDEIRISNIIRPVDWLDTTYNTIALSSDFQYISIGEEELASSTDPIVSSPSPEDGATNQDFQPICSVLCVDPDGDPMDVYFYENTTGSWVLQQTNSSHPNNTRVEWDNYNNASSYDTEYWWSVNITDGSTWDNETFSFTTTDIPPILSNPSPTNGSTGNPSELVWSIQMNDTQGDTLSWSIECSNGQSSEGSGQPPYNTPTLADTDMFVEKWRVLRSSFGHYISCEPVTADINGDGIEEIFIGGRETGYDYLTEQWAFMSCLDGATGVEIWQTNFTVDFVDEYGVGFSSNQHWCPVIYDFNKTNPGLEITWSGGMKYHRMYSASDGTVLWNTSAFAGGWHNIGYIDDGTDVFLYTIEGINSIKAYAQDGDEGLTKSYANNGTMIKRARHYYECFGGPAIADINDDGIYEVLVTDRSGSEPGVYRGLSCYDEDLNFLWAYQDSTFSTQVPIIADVDDDGDLEIISGSQGGSNYGKAVVFSGDPSGAVGEIEFTSLSLGKFHHQVSIGNTDDDTNLEMVNVGGTSYSTYVYDFIDNERITLSSSGSTHNADITNIVKDDGVQINEIITMRNDGIDNNAAVYQYNTSSTNYDKIYEFGLSGIYTAVSDVDFDGYKELILTDWNGITVYETNVSIQDPKPITSVAHGGMRRMTNDEFIHPPGYYEFTIYGEDNGTKNLSLSDLSLGTTYTVWVNATDSGSGLWNRSVFTFSTLAPSNDPPITKNPVPANNSVDVDISLQYFDLDIEDPDGNPFNYSIDIAPLGDNFIALQTYNISGHFELSAELGYNTTYTAYANVTDYLGSDEWTRNWYNFTTEEAPLPPVFGVPVPANNSYINVPYVNWTIDISDPNEDDIVKWSIECSNGQNLSWGGEQYFGSNGTEITGLQSFEGDIVGIPWKMDNVNGIATNISINIGCSGQSYTVKCALYDADRYYIAETEEKIIYPSDGLTWKPFNFTDDDILLALNTTYYVVAMMNQSDTPAHSCSIVWENESGDNSSVWILIDYGYGEFPEFDYNTSAVQWSDNDTTLHMRLYYDSSVGGVKSIFLTDLVNSETYTVWVNATDSIYTVKSIYYFTYSNLTVITNASTNIEGTNATLNAFLESDGGYLTSVWFEVWNGTAYNRTDYTYDLNLVNNSDDLSGIYQAIDSNGSYVFAGMHANGLGAYSFINDELTLLDAIYGTNNPDVWVNDTTIYTTAWSYGLYAYHFDYDTETLSLMGSVDDGGSYRDLCVFNDYIIVAADPYMYAYSFDGVDTFTLLDSIPWWGVNAFDSNASIIYGVGHEGNLVAFTFDGSSFTELNDDMSASESYDLVVDENNYVHIAEKDDGLTAYSYNVSGNYFTKLDSVHPADVFDVKTDGEYIYASCMANGVYAYTFDGAEYTFADSVSIYSNDVHANGSYLYVGNNIYGIYVYDTILNLKIYEQTEFAENLADLNLSTLYHYRAAASNIENTFYGVDVAFLTLPNMTYNLAVTEGIYEVNLSWDIGDGANTTYVERNTASSWNRGEGTFIYNGTGSFYKNVDVPPNILYYYQLWSYANWTEGGTTYYQYSSYNTTSGTAQTLEPPTNGASSYNTSSHELNLSWDAAAFSDAEIVVQNNNSQPTSHTDGWVRYNGSAETFTGVQTSTAYFTVWSYNDTLKVYSLSGLDISWGVLHINVYNENQPWIPVSNYDLLITNEDGSETYYDTGLSNPVIVSFENIPYGINTVVQISHDDYETKNTYIDLYLNTYNNFTFYLVPKEILVPPGEEGEEDCIIRSFIDSLSISTFTEDLLINLTHTLEDLIQVEIYNSSLFGTYGGWIVVANDLVDYNTTRVIINQSIIDINSSMARVSYYYESCDPTYIPSGLYYIRIVESYVTSFGVTDLSIEDAKVTFQKYMNTTDRYENISTLFTDNNGFVNLYLIPGSLYRVVIEKSGYQTKTASYQPAPPNDFGQTTEKVFRIERTDTESESELDIPNETVVVVPYNTTVFEIYYLNLNNDNLYVNFSIYDGGTLIFTYNETTDPDEIWLYFNFSNYTLNNDILTLIVNATKSNTSFIIHVRYFSITQATRLTGPTLAPIAAIISICLCMFGLTLSNPKKVFGVFGMIVLIVAIAITAFAPQIWYLHLIQAIEIILLIVVILTFKEEGIHAV